jgi:Na+/H+ antiporter NhaC
VLYSVLGAILLAVALSKAQGLLGLQRAGHIAMKGMAGMLPLAILMLLAFAIGDVAKAMGTGDYVASVAEPYLSPVLLPALIFVVGAFVAFSTGTSWGTFAILIPIVVPLSTAIGSPLPIALAAALGGGVFGDHASPISDTSVISSMAAASDHIDHVRTQLPYALTAAGVAVVGYLILGALTA